jgi:hypothetical protein
MKHTPQGKYREAPLESREVQFTVPTRYAAIELVAPQGVAERRVTMWGGTEVHDVHRAANPYPSRNGDNRNSVNKRYRKEAV